MAFLKKIVSLFIINICFLFLAFSNDFHLSIEPTFGYATGQLDEIIYHSSDKSKKISLLEWERKFLVPNLDCNITFYEGEVLGVMLPDKVDLVLTVCEPAVKGNTATAALKDATTETGLLVKVPLFIEEGELVLVRTDNGEYDGRA